jgi:1-acyl-sn-glycerol-3-phosphate acyltransferase
MGVWQRLRDQVSRSVDRRLGPDVARRTRALAIRQNEYGYDPFGFHAGSIGIPLLVMRWLYRSYFRCEAHGVEHVPARGRVLLVANHSGQLPFDGMVIAAAMFFDAPHPRVVRSMVERFVPAMPFASYLLSRWGQITGTPENCRRLLDDDEAILVFPEGARGVSKPFSQRYQLQRFGLGFLRLALETRTPIVPVAVVGAEEQAPAVDIKPIARLLGTPSFPVVPYPPFIPVPLPVKYRLYFGEPLELTGDPDDDHDVVDEKVRAVKHRIQSMLHWGLKERRHVFW